MLGHLHARVVEVKAVTRPEMFARFHMSLGAKSMEHWVGKRLNKRVAAMAVVREVVGNIDRFFHAELILTSILLVIEVSSFLTLELHIKLIHISRCLQFILWKLILLLENRAIHESKILIEK